MQEKSKIMKFSNESVRSKSEISDEKKNELKWRVSY